MCAGIPCLFGYLLYKNRRRLKVPVVMARYGLLYEGTAIASLVQLPLIGTHMPSVDLQRMPRSTGGLKLQM